MGTRYANEHANEPGTRQRTRHHAKRAPIHHANEQGASAEHVAIGSISVIVE